jgi:hypothetical protein
MIGHLRLRLPPELPAARQVERRLACAACPHHIAATDTCALVDCGCTVADLIRRPWHTCPADQWPPEDWPGGWVA